MKGKIILSVLASACIAMTLTGCMCEHEWNSATCTTPKTCTLCEKTEGELLPHNWQDATCTAPKTCKDCKLTEGETLPHTWVDADCEKAKTCNVCKATEGDALGHTWSDATCEQAKTCSVCNKTEGKKLGHQIKEWEIIEESTCSADGQKTGKCIRCNEIIESSVPRLEHTPGEWQIIEKAGYSTSGKRSTYCKVCNAVCATEKYELTADEKEQVFKSECVKYTYNEIARNPSNYYWKQVKFRGEVIQVIEDGDKYTLRVNVTPKNYYWTDTILVQYTKQDSSEPRILEDDIVTLYGYAANTITYESVMGASITVPAVLAIYVNGEVIVNDCNFK